MNRKEICKNAIQERWHPTIPKATHEGVIFIGDQTLECDVLPDGRRILRHRAFAKAMGKAKSSGQDMERSKELKIPVFVCANNLRPYLGKDFLERSTQIIYKSKDGRRLIGYEANLLTEACKVYVKADDDKALQAQQIPIANVCRSILYSLASVGIVALIDEATGYQEARAIDELQKILDKYISEELRAWTEKFPNEFFKQIYRVYGWNYPKIGKNHPQCVAGFINKYIYGRLPPGILEALKNKNPPNERGNRKYRHHQWIGEDFGDENLNKQIVQIISYLKISKNIKELDEILLRAEEN